MILTAAQTNVSPIFTVTAILAIYLIGRLIYKIFATEINNTHENPTIPKPNWTIPTYNTQINSQYASSYMKAPLLTRRELKHYHILKELADERNLLICPKVRLLDLVVPKPGIKNYGGLKTRVMSKHVDFVVCQQDMEVICIIELDDKTHQRPDRIQRDRFVDSVLIGAGYKIIHTWEMTSDILDFYAAPKRPEHIEEEYRIYVDRTKPTYEEWKAAKLAEDAQKNADQSSTAPGPKDEP